ncbi:hypothetical protein ANAPC5_01395 [Anaplasma phagocytophilum]|nr:hypothetical protein ANAPC5_01395 [Anaplasma phagocytophilum]
MTARSSSLAVQGPLVLSLKLCFGALHPGTWATSCAGRLAAPAEGVEGPLLKIQSIKEAITWNNKKE